MLIVLLRKFFFFNIPTEDFDKLLMIDVIQSNWRNLLNKCKEDQS